MISHALCSNTVPIHFNIAHNGIHDEGAVALSKCLACNSTLKDLEIQYLAKVLNESHYRYAQCEMVNFQ